MLSQTLKIDLAAGDVYDICSLASGMLICSAMFIDEETGCYSSIPDGALCNACDGKDNQIYQLTAAAAMKGWLVICEVFDSGPDCVKWPVAKAVKEAVKSEPAAAAKKQMKPAA